MPARSAAPVALAALVLLATGCSAPEPSGCPTAVTRAAATVPAVTTRPARAFPDARSDYSMTPLPSGKVLVAGGKTTGASATATSWLYDPDSGAWEPTGAMSTARSNHAAVLLADGRVLAIAGLGIGYDPARFLTSAELYDPATGTWDPTGSVSTSRYYFSATRLPDGRVLVAGGIHPHGAVPSYDSTASCELYDPATGVWAPAAPLPAARSNHTGTLLPGGRVLVAGGEEGLGGVFPVKTTAFRYDSVADAWSVAAPLARARALHTAILLRDGTVLVAGGVATSVALATAERYDPVADRWASAGSLATARFAHAAAVLPSGAVVIVGGTNSGTPLASVERFDPGASGWTPAGILSAARCYLRASVLPDGRVLAGPGWEGGAVRRAEADLVDGTGPSWSAGPPVAAPRVSGAAVALLPGRVRTGGGPAGPILVAGGRDLSGAPRADAELYDTASSASPSEAAVTLAMPVARANFTATVLAGRRVLLAGGEGPDGVLARVDVLELGSAADPTLAWTTAAPLATARAGHTATLLRDGSILVVGGRDGSGTPVATAERYDPRTRRWADAGAPSSPRVGHTATLLGDGSVLVAGGVGAGPHELYDPSSNGWSTAPAQAGSGRAFHTATPLLDGRVLLAGGVDGADAPLASAALWAPDGAVSAPAPLAGARAHHAAVLLPTGHVLVAGGSGAGGPAASAELFDPATGTWATVPGMAVARSSFALTLLPDGGALAVGGSAGETATDRFSTGTHPPPPDAPSVTSWPSVMVAGRGLDVIVSPTLPGDGTDGSPGSGNAALPSFVVVRGDGQSAGRAPAAASGQPQRWLVPDLGGAPAWLFPVVAGALGDGVPVTLDPPLGWACELDSQCPSGACVDGVCCDTPCGGGAADCQACSAAAGSAVDGSCAPLPAGTTCRAAAGACDVAESCDGTSAECPADAFAQAGTTCRAAAGPCDVPEACTGSSPACPADVLVAAGTTCRAAADRCDAAEVCSGAAASCPVDLPADDGTACGAGGSCRAGACVTPRSPPSRPPRGGCGTGEGGFASLALAALAAATARRRVRR
jgi:hypothetical protein